MKITSGTAFEFISLDCVSIVTRGLQHLEFLLA